MSVYKTVGMRLYMVVAPDGWKARHIAAAKHVSVTVPVRRGGVLPLVLPIPPAAISFHATAIVHAAGSVKIASLSKELESLLPRGRRDAGALIELIPEGHFLTYGIGIPLMDIGCEAFVGDILTLPRRLHGKVVLRGHAGFDRLPHGPDPCVAMGPGCRVES